MTFMPELQKDGWELESAEERHLAAPDSFPIPSEEERANVLVGSKVKLLFLNRGHDENGDYIQHEPLWVKVTEASESRYIGILEGRPKTSDVLSLGSRIAFGPEHIASIRKRHLIYDFETIKKRRADPFLWNLDRYVYLVKEIEDGYEDYDYEYINDICVRSTLQEKLDEGYVPDDETAERLRQLDERLRAMLIPTTKSIYGNFPPQYFWFYGVPRNAEKVLEDARSLGIIA